MQPSTARQKPTSIVELHGDGDLYLLDRRAIRDGTMRLRNRRNRPSQFDMSRLKLQEIAAQADREAGIDDREQRP